MSNRTLLYRPAVFMVLVAMSGCTPDTSVAIYKYQYKQGLVEVCDKDEGCVADVEKHFDRCVDSKKVIEMLMTVNPARSRELNDAISKTTLDCINAASGVEHFYYHPPTDENT